MILLDAGVLIRYIRHHEPAIENALEKLDVAICGITRSEILHGGKSDADITKLIALLDRFRPIPLPETIWDQTGRRLCELRRRGIIVPFTDVVLATLAFEQNLELWTYDAHFQLIFTVWPLRLFQLPAASSEEG